jgi:2-dehydropantoate 2-reductase
MRIAVVGAGAIGGYVGARLSAAGADVTFLARGAHLVAMQANGLRIHSPLGDLHMPRIAATDDPVRIGPVDLALFTVKLKDTRSAARSMRPLLAPHTRVLTLQNGIDSVEMIAEEIPRDHIVDGVILLSAVIREPGLIGNPGGAHRITVDAMHGDKTIAGLVELGASTVGLEIIPTDDIQSAIWQKFIALVAMSGATSLMRRPLGDIRANPETRIFLRQLAEETLAVAVANGFKAPADHIERTLAIADAAPPQTRSSMSEDLARGKPLELAWLAGRVHALGLQLGIPTPANSAVYRGLILYADGAPA